MKIQSVYIDGFKNLSNVRLDLERITALVSLNNFGKSNVLTAIDFAIEFIKATTEGKYDMMANINYIPMNRKMVGRNFRFEMEALAGPADAEYRVQYGFAFAWKTNEEKDPVIIGEFLRIKTEEKGQKYTQVLDRNEKRIFYKSCETGRCSSRLKTEGTELAINKLKAFDSLYYAELIRQLNTLRFYMENGLDARSNYQQNQIVRRGLDDFVVTEADLPRILYKLKDEQPEKFDLLKAVLSQLFPNIDDVIVMQYNLDCDRSGKLPNSLLFLMTNAVYVLYVKMNYLALPIDFSMMSDGVKRVLLILTKVLLAQISNVSLVAIEEPENSVHPGLFQSYINIISDLMDDCKIIITSNSPYIISYLSPTCIKVGVEREKGIAEFFAFKPMGQKALQSAAAALGISMGDCLFSMIADSDPKIKEYLDCDI